MTKNNKKQEYYYKFNHNNEFFNEVLPEWMKSDNSFYSNHFTQISGEKNRVIENAKKSLIIEKDGVLDTTTLLKKESINENDNISNIRTTLENLGIKKDQVDYLLKYDPVSYTIPLGFVMQGITKNNFALAKSSPNNTIMNIDRDGNVTLKCSYKENLNGQEVELVQSFDFAKIASNQGKLEGAVSYSVKTNFEINEGLSKLNIAPYVENKKTQDQNASLAQNHPAQIISDAEYKNFTQDTKRAGFAEKLSGIIIKGFEEHKSIKEISKEVHDFVTEFTEKQKKKEFIKKPAKKSPYSNKAQNEAESSENKSNHITLSDSKNLVLECSKHYAGKKVSTWKDKILDAVNKFITTKILRKEYGVEKKLDPKIGTHLNKYLKEKMSQPQKHVNTV